jgi:hypothetical protein
LDALLDTGSDICVFDAMFLEQLGLKLTAGKADAFSGLGGEVDGYWHRLMIDPMLGHKALPAVDIMFVKGLADETNQVGILGMSGFFQFYRFIVTAGTQQFDLEYLGD